MTQMETFKTQAVDHDWWRGAVIYQVYPRSFQDSNGDGIGDLAGIIQRMPHIAELGADAIWISPFFTSPMLDFGYDVSDYRDVDPMFGTLDDFRALISRAKELGLKILIDLVLSHTSDQHPWFTESRAGKTNDKSDWYVWADAKPDGTPPNNWLSIFGGPAWEWDGQRMQYYLHNFLKEQPDLNLHEPAVQDELLDVARFWLDLGVDGFRLDTINFYFHDKALRNNPHLPPEERNDLIAPQVNPYNWQDHRYDKNQPENLAFLKRLRVLLDEYPAKTIVGEVGDAQRGLEIQAQYTSGDDMVHMCYDFSFLSNMPLSGMRVADVLTRFEEVGRDGWACWAFSNHDVVRHPSRWNLGESQVRLHAALLLSLKGSVCLYQGEELGLTEADVAFEDLQDPYGVRFWPKFKGRDGCRTPMPWVTDNANGGFSAAKPWLPVEPSHLRRSVGFQGTEQNSLLDFYKRAIAYRQARSALTKGSISFFEQSDDVMVMLREHEGQRLCCAFNFSNDEISLTLPKGDWEPDPLAPFAATIADQTLQLGPVSAGFLRDATNDQTKG